jgi:hypothetical protein
VITADAPMLRAWAERWLLLASTARAGTIAAQPFRLAPQADVTVPALPGHQYA